ncbi:PCL7 [Candida margitis]|uniref:PCL7 n=1 Tax=Candida margitis TaxID=1775924 RepID=UPI0022269760|nr:PCL7 [Candida margitis]KAI5958412.1 PCL7 [Candida margitis]
MSTNFHHDDSSTTNSFQSANLNPSKDIHQPSFCEQGDRFDGDDSSVPHHSTKSQVSNLTRTLQSSSSGNSTLQSQQNFDDDPQSTQSHAHSTDPRELITGVAYDKGDDGNASYQTQHSAFPQQIPIAQNSYKHMPMSHNTPTAVGTSYTSAHSYNPSLPSTNNFITQPESSSFHDHTAPSSFRPNTMPHAFPTTTVQTDSVVPTKSSFSTASGAASSLHSTSYSIPGNQFQHPMIHHPTQVNSAQFAPNQRVPNSLPTGHKFGNTFPTFNQQQQQQQQQPQSARRLQSLLNADKQTGLSTASATTSTGSINIPHNSRIQNLQQDQSHIGSFHSTPPYYEHVQQNTSGHQQWSEYARPEPDHYLTYGEFLQELKKKDEQERPNAGEEHLNIVEFPVNDLIVMLSCLLTKIIEANDKLHPNHFENTIAIRQKIKDERKQKKLQRKNKQKEYRQGTIVGGVEGEDTVNAGRNKDERGNYDGDHFGVSIHSEDRMDEDDDDDDDDQHEVNVDYDDDFVDDEDEEEDNEMKNKYLANVLAFHGTNVPGISLHAYLARVLKYCPVTNEVFLSLLVYFDRIAKKANNLNQKRKSRANGDGHDDSDTSEAEQLFVMDSYNIHRLIISGITVSSKFFSDIFYKNLRYAKVGGLPLEELNYLELQFLLLLDFKLMISVEDLQNYGDLLARFWKREQSNASEASTGGDSGNN